MTVWPLIPWIAGFAAMALLLAAVLRFVFQESRRTLALDGRLQAVRNQAVAAAEQLGTHLEKPAATLSYLSMAGVGLLRVAARLVPVSASERAKIGEVIRQAGFQRRDALALFLSVKLAFMLIVSILAGVFVSGSEQLGGSSLWIGFGCLAGFVLGGLLPESVLQRLKAQRQARMASAVPDALDLMVLCIAAAYTFDRALYIVSQELEPLAPELAGELSTAEAELRLGTDRRSVLENLYARTGVEGLNEFTTTILQGERFGTPMGQSIQNMARNQRLQRAQRIEAAAGRLSVLMSLPMLVLVVPGILLLMGGPAFILVLEALSGAGALFGP